MLLSRRLGFQLIALAFLSSVACEVLVGDTPSGPISCVPESFGTCPAGQMCAASGTCVQCPGGNCLVTVLDAGHDSTVPQAEAAAHDTGVDRHVSPPPDVGVDSGPTGVLGEACTSSARCESGLCATPGDLPALNLPSGVCSQTCCSNADCGGDFTCYATPGGNLCVATTVANCGSTCPTSCCGASGCGSGQACGLPASGTSPSCQSFQGDMSICYGGELPGGVGGDACDQASDCASGLCLQTGSGICPNTCTGPCCKDTDCSMDGSSTCQWVEITDSEGTPTQYALSCEKPPKNAMMTGAACTTTGGAPTPCSGNVCANDVCTGPCCTDADCGALTGAKCLPYNVALGGGTVALLVCQVPSR
jgi:hypothetical protein